MTNTLLDVELNDGDITEEEYARRCWLADEMWPEGGRVADPRMEGPGIRWPKVSTWRIRWAQVTLAQGVNRQLRLVDREGRLHLIDRPSCHAGGRCQ